MGYKKNFWNILSTISGLIAAIVALITVSISISSLQEANQSKRPYFIIEKPGIKALPNSPPFRIQITLYNTGIHPAINTVGNIVFFNKSLDEEPQYNIVFSVANEIPNNSPTPWYTDSVFLPTNLSPQYIILKIDYGDPILEQLYSQTFYMRWNGVQDGITQPDFVHVGIDEKNNIINYLKEIKPIKLFNGRNHFK